MGAGYFERDAAPTATQFVRDDLELPAALPAEFGGPPKFARVTLSGLPSFVRDYPDAALDAPLDAPLG